MCLLTEIENFYTYLSKADSSLQSIKVMPIDEQIIGLRNGWFILLEEIWCSEIYGIVEYNREDIISVLIGTASTTCLALNFKNTAYGYAEVE
jgi:hypothetical protein